MLIKRCSSIILSSLAILMVVCAGVLAEPAQTTDIVFMVSPDDFQYNVETAKSNIFQHRPEDSADVIKLAMEQFNNYVRRLETSGVNVINVHSRRDIKTPDAVFPNNWFSTHKTEDGKNIVVVYPMLTPNRRAERRVALLKEKTKQHGIEFNRIVDLSYYEKNNQALEGTGSLVLERIQQVAFASLSPRTDKEVVDSFCKQLNYRPIVFHSYDSNGELIYHTNVMMSVGEGFAVVCLDAIKDHKEKKRVLTELDRLGKKIIKINLSQMQNMCGNILELNTEDKTKIIVMSVRAYSAFTDAQKTELEKFGKLLPVDIHTIEDIDGGGARCMIAEVF